MDRSAHPMHLTCHPAVWDEAHGLYPVDIKELQIAASPEELKRLAGFLLKSAASLESRPDAEHRESFADVKPRAEKAIEILVCTGSKPL